MSFFETNYDNVAFSFMNFFTFNIIFALNKSFTFTEQYPSKFSNFFVIIWSNSWLDGLHLDDLLLCLKILISFITFYWHYFRSTYSTTRRVHNDDKYEATKLTRQLRKSSSRNEIEFTSMSLRTHWPMREWTCGCLIRYGAKMKI